MNMNILKKATIGLIVSCVLVTSMPCFSIRSQAVGTTTTATYAILYYLTTYFATRGYSIIKDSDNSISSLADWRDKSVEEIADILYEISVALDNFGNNHGFTNLGSTFFKALSLATITGKFVIDKTAQDLVDRWLESRTNPTTGSATVGHVKASLEDLSIPANTQILFYTTRFDYRSVYCDVPVNAFVFNNTVGFCPTYIDDYTFFAAGNYYLFDMELSGGGSLPLLRNITIDNKTYTYRTDTISLVSNHTFQYFDVSELYDSLDAAIYDFLTGELNGYSVGDFTTSRITDTTNTDVLSSTNEIASDASVTGPMTLYIPDEATLVDLIDQYNNVSISYDELIAALGLSVVASDATQATKEDALASVAVPDSTYDWLTRTAWGYDTVAETTEDMTKTHTEEDSIADSIGDTLKGGNDSEDDNNKNRGKGLLAALLIGLGIWTTPIIAGDPSGESDSGGTDDDNSEGNPAYLADTVAGMAIAGSLVNDFFDAAGGSDGYGFIYTVGASFVIFSVIIGAANYFGALFHGEDTKQASKPSAKNNSPNRNRKQSSYSNKNDVVT